MIMDMENIVNKETLKGAVMRQITCEISGRVLDVRTAIHVEVTMKNGRILTTTVHSDEEEELNRRINRIKDLPNVAGIKAYDGRDLFGRKRAIK